MNSNDDLLPLIRQVMQLNKIKVIVLNRKREKLALYYGSLITIDLKEDIHLATKRALIETNINLIRLERNESLEWDFNFAK